MALDRNRGRINVKGGGKFKLREESPTASNSWLDLGWATSLKLVDEHSMVDIIDDGGNFVDSKSGGRKATWEAVLKQSGIDEINLLKNAEGKYYDLYYSVLVANDTLTQEISIPLGKIKPGVVLEFKSATERTLAVQISCLAPKADYVRTPTAFNVTENVPYVITEGAVANDPPTDTASTLATAIL